MAPFKKAVNTITSTYDANDQLTSISDPAATINLTLDNLGRRTSISNAIAGLTPTVTLAQNFNAAGGRTELKATIGSTLDFRNTYQFDVMRRELYYGWHLLPLFSQLVRRQFAKNLLSITAPKRLRMSKKLSYSGRFTN